MWDVFTAVHVLSSGTYRLLPEIIETRLAEDAAALGVAAVANPLRPPLSDALISSTVARLNNTLHIKLLSTPLPAALSNIDIRDGMAYLTFGDEFELGVSLRMGPAPAAPPDADATAAEAAARANEEQRINWRLFHLRVLMNVESQSSVASDAHATAAPAPLLNDAQLLHLIVLLNHVSFEQPNPLLIFYSTLHALLLGIAMDIVHAQSLNLTRLFGMHDTQVEYAHAHKRLNIHYWREAKHMPLEGTVPAAKHASVVGAGVAAPAQPQLLSPCLQILVDERDRLSIRHNPPLPACDSVPDLLSLQMNALSLTHLLANVLQHHGNQRIAQLFMQLQRDATDKARTVVGAMEIEVTQREVRKARHRSSMPPPPPNDSLDAAMHKLSVAAPAPAAAAAAAPLVPRQYLVVRLLAGYTVCIHTDLQTGRFVLEWAPAETDTESQCNLTALYGGALSALNRMLYAETLRINQHIAGAFDSLLHLRMACLTMQLASVCAQLPACNARARVVPVHVPFSARASAASSPAVAAAIQAAARHVAYDTTLSGVVTSSSWQSRLGFGPYTITIQLAGYAAHQYLLLQLNPYAQLTPRCYFVHAELAQSQSKRPNDPSVRHALPFIQELRALHWPLSADDIVHDPSEGFSSPLHHAALASLLSQAEALLPLCVLSSQFHTRFRHLINSAQVCAGDEGEPVPELQAIIRSRTSTALAFEQQQKRTAQSAGGAALPSLSPSPPPHLLVQLHFPLNATMHHPDSLLMQVPGDAAAATADAHPQPHPQPRLPAQLLIYAMPPGAAAQACADIPTAVPAVDTNRNGARAAAVAVSSFGFIVYVSHPLLAKLLTAFRHMDAQTAQAPAWQNFASIASRQGEPSSWLHASSSVVALAYDAVDAEQVARCVYDLDNLYASLCMLSNLVAHTRAQLLHATNGLADADADAVADEVVEHVPGGGSNGVPAPGTNYRAAVAQLSAVRFPPHFFRVSELSCNQLTLTYLHPNQGSSGSSSASESALCSLVIRRDHGRGVWKRDLMAQPDRLFTHKGGPFFATDLVEYTIAQTPHPWPQLPFYQLDFNRTRISAHSPPPLLKLLQHVWLGAQSMLPICRFVTDVQRWQAMGGIGSEHLVSRLQMSPATVHCVAESSTRLRLLYGQCSSGVQSSMWRNKADLRLVYEDQVLQDFKAGRPLRRAPGEAESCIEAGKIAGDVTVYLHNWYRSVFTSELQRCIKQLETRAAAGVQLPRGVRLELNSDTAESGQLADPILKIVADPAATALSAAELHCVETYLAHRIVSPPFNTESFFTFHKALALSASAPVAAAAAAATPAAVAAPAVPNGDLALRQLIQLWALELLQPHPFPQPFPHGHDRALLQSLLPEDVAAAAPAPLSFRLLTILRAPFDLEFHADSRMLAFTVECAEARTIVLHAAALADGRAAEPPVPVALQLPLAYDVINHRLCRWEVPRNSARVFTPLPPSLPPFTSLAAALRFLMTATLPQLALWCTTSAPPVTNAVADGAQHAAHHAKQADAHSLKAQSAASAASQHPSSQANGHRAQ